MIGKAALEKEIGKASCDLQVSERAGAWAAR